MDLPSKFSAPAMPSRIGNCDRLGMLRIYTAQLAEVLQYATKDDLPEHIEDYRGAHGLLGDLLRAVCTIESLPEGQDWPSSVVVCYGALASVMVPACFLWREVQDQFSDLCVPSLDQYQRFRKTPEQLQEALTELDEAVTTLQTIDSLPSLDELRSSLDAFQAALAAGEDDSDAYKGLVASYKAIREYYTPPLAAAWTSLADGVDRLPGKLREQTRRTPEASREELQDFVQTFVDRLNAHHGCSLRLVVEEPPTLPESEAAA